MPVMKPLWLFDFDGVIADSFNFFEALLKKSLKELGYNFLQTKDDFANLFRDNLYSSLTRHGVTKDDLINLFAHIETNVDFSPVHLFDGIVEAVVKISKSAHTALLSSNRESQIAQILKVNGADKYLTQTILGFNTNVSKSAKIKKAIEDFKASATSTYYVGDTIGDILETRAAGAKSVAVGWGWHSPEELKKYGPDYFVRTVPELVALAERL